MVIYDGVDGVALVFDDGPNPKLTPKILEVLHTKGVVANFFLIGKKAEQSPEVVQQIAENGHEIGNHTYTHKHLTQVLQDGGKQAVLAEIKDGAQAIEAIIGADNVTFLRPPYLDFDESVADIAESLYGEKIIMSGTASGDYGWGVNHTWSEDDVSAIQEKAQIIFEDWATAPTGTIIGLHDSSEHNLPGNASYDTWMNRALPTLEALPHIIDALRQRGLKFYRLRDMELVKEPLRTNKQ